MSKKTLIVRLCVVTYDLDFFVNTLLVDKL